MSFRAYVVEEDVEICVRDAGEAGDVVKRTGPCLWRNVEAVANQQASHFENEQHTADQIALTHSLSATDASRRVKSQAEAKIPRDDVTPSASNRHIARVSPPAMCYHGIRHPCRLQRIMLSSHGRCWFPIEAHEGQIESAQSGVCLGISTFPNLSSTV